MGKRKPQRRTGLRFCFGIRRKTIATRKKTPTGKQAKSNNDTGVLRDFIVESLDADKAEDIVTIDLTGKSVIADYMVIATGRSARQVSALGKKLSTRLSEKGTQTKVEGLQVGDWVVVDAGDVVVHLFRPEVRDFYGLEKLWATDFSTVGYNLYTTQ